MMVITNKASIVCYECKGIFFVYLAYEKVVETLISNGANVNLRNQNDRTALDIATENGKSSNRKVETKNVCNFQS